MMAVRGSGILVQRTNDLSLGLVAAFERVLLRYQRYCTLFTKGIELSDINCLLGIPNVDNMSTLTLL